MRYFSSSANKEFIELQKTNPEQFKYKIIEVYQDERSALALEIKLHDKLDVAVNEGFYNKVKQTHTGLDRTGMVTVVKDLDGNTFHVSVGDPRYLSGELVCLQKGTRWYHHLILKINKKYRPGDDIPDGFVKGIKHFKKKAVSKE